MESTTAFCRIICSRVIATSGYDQCVFLTNMEGVAFFHWSMTPLTTALPSVNPPFVYKLAYDDRRNRLYCGLMDGSVRYLKYEEKKGTVIPVITTHTGGVSDVDENGVDKR